MKSSDHDRMAPAAADSVAESLWESDARPWDKYWVPIFLLFAKQLALISSPSPGDVILDIGTGSGLAVRELCKRTPSVGLVVGIDFSEAMIRLARRRAASAGLRNVKFLKMGGNGVFSEDQREIELFMDQIQFGVVYANRRGGATTGAWPGAQTFVGWKASGATGRGVGGPNYLLSFVREQSRTIASQ